MLDYQPARTFHDLGGRGEPPLPRWCDPKVGEPAHGFLVRLAELNKHSDSSTICRTFGLTPRDLNPGECLDFCLSLPISGAEDLIHATPRFGADSVELLGQKFRRRQWRGLRRFCPACLAEEPYHRAWWDLRPFRFCPFHDLPLTSCDLNGRPVNWNRASFSRSAEGTRLSAAAERLAVPRPSLETYLLGRMGVIPPTPTPLLDREVHLGEAIAITQFVGRVHLQDADSVALTESDDIEAAINDLGFSALAQGEAHFVELFSDLLDRCDRKSDGAGLEAAFGGLYAKAIALESSTAFRPITDAMRTAVAARGIQVAYRNPSLSLDLSSEWVPISALGDELGLTRAKTIELINSMMLAGSCTTRNGALNCISREGALSIKSVVDELLSDRAAAKLLGLSTEFFRALVDKRVFVPFASMHASGRAGRRYKAEELRAAADKFLAGVPVLDEIPPNGRTLSSFKDKRDPYAQLFLTALDAGVPFIMGRTGKNFGDLVTQKLFVDIAKKLNFWAHAPGLSRATAATIIGVRKAVVDALIDAGHLSVMECDAPQPRLDAKAVHEFAQIWAPAKLYASLRNISIASWYEELTRSDIETLVVEDSSGGATSRCVFVARSTLDKLRVCYPELFQKAAAIELVNQIKDKISGDAQMQVTKLTPHAVSILANNHNYRVEIRLDQNQIKICRRAKRASAAGQSLARRQRDMARFFNGGLQVKLSDDTIEISTEFEAECGRTQQILSAIAAKIYDQLGSFIWAVA